MVNAMNRQGCIDTGSNPVRTTTFKTSTRKENDGKEVQIKGNGLLPTLNKMFYFKSCGGIGRRYTE